MFRRSLGNGQKRSFGHKNGVRKITKPVKTSFKDDVVVRMLDKASSSQGGRPLPDLLTSPIIPIFVGKEQRMFASHKDVLSLAPFFAALCKTDFFESNNSIYLPDEESEIFSCVLEFLYKGDYYPRMKPDKRAHAGRLDGGDEDEDSPQPDNTSNTGVRAGPGVEATYFHHSVGDTILRDTAVYCAADRYGLEDLKRLALRKQGLQSNVEVGVVLRSARYAYDNTSDSDSRLRAYFLALIIRSRRTFKRSGTMQSDMEAGGKLFFDLFCSMANYIDDLESCHGTPRTI